MLSFMTKPKFQSVLSKKLDEARINLVSKLATMQQYEAQRLYAQADVEAQRKLIGELEALVESEYATGLPLAMPEPEEARSQGHAVAVHVVN